MKKILSVLTVCLVTLLPLNSQTLSSDTCCVPCESLRKTILVNREKDNLKKQLVFSRDTIFTLSEIILAKDSTLIVKDSTISMYRRNTDRYKWIISEKDSIIVKKDNEISNLKRDKNTAYAVGFFSVAFSILLMLF